MPKSYVNRFKVSLRYLLVTMIFWSSASIGAQPMVLSEAQQVSLQEALDLAERQAIGVDDLRRSLISSQSPEARAQAQLAVLQSLIRRFATGQYSSSIDSLWDYPARSVDLEKATAKVLAAPVMLNALESLLPQHTDYKGLVDAYADLASIAVSEPEKLGAMGLIKPDEMSEFLPLIRDRLEWRGYAANDEASALVPRLYDDLLVEQVRQFQADHGLKVDGVIGPQTVDWLNKSASELRTIIAAVLERWRWMPRELGSEYLLVSIPGFEVRLFNSQGVAQRHISISGRPTRPTSSFSATVEQFVVNPDWTVPKRIMMLDKMPKLVSDPAGYLASHNMQVQRLTNGAWRTVAPASVDWASVGWDTQDLRLVQSPGDSNALGKLKFHMPNSHVIYLHDTPSKELFADASRAFSSGCIRVQGVQELARTLMHDQVSVLDAELEQSATRWVRLPTPVPVYLMYNRAWIGERGRLQLREDIYSADRALMKAAISS